MRNFVPGSEFLTSLIGSSAFHAASQQSEMIQNITGSMQLFQSYGASSKLRDITSALGGMTTVLTQLRKEHIFDTPKVLLNLRGQIDIAYHPIFDIAKQVTIISENWSAMGQSAQLLGTLHRIEPKTIEGISKALELYGSGIQRLASDISVEELEEYCETGEITPDTVAEAAETICAETNEDKLTIPEHLEKIKRTNWYFAFSLLLLFASFFCKPVVDHAADKVLETTGITSFWEGSGIYELIDQFIAEFSGNSTLSEEDAKASIEQKGGNLSKQKRDDLLSKISAIRAYIAAAPQDENTADLLTYLSDLEKDVNGKKYGLVFEEHQEAIDTVLAEHTPVLTEEPKLLIDNGGEMNFLLEGDNLAALQLLEKTHRGRIDLIYIDPPYNTGNKDFVYDDCFVDAQDTFRHSKWLSFMSKRLELAKHLLSERGVIFISIDDREQAGLKLLCDKIFDESCFVADVSWQRTYSTRNDSKGIVSEVEHILVYSGKPDWSPNKLPRTEKMNSIYKNPDNDVMPWTSDNPFAADAATHQGMVYAIQHPFTGKLLYPSAGAHWRYKQEDMLEIMSGWCAYELKDLHDAEKRAAVCGIPENEVRRDVQAIVLSEPLEISTAKAQAIYDRGQWPKFFFTKGGKGGIRRKTYLANVGGKLPTNFWPYSDVGHTDEAKKETGKILGDMTAFSTPKPVRLMDRIITIASQPDSIILDFFAGSGTTGHGVLAHNAAHPDSRRKFILCTNNENNICRNVTYERIKRVIEREGYAASLKYYRIDYVPISQQLYYEYADELLRHIRELVELENGVNFIENAEIAIVLTDEELADFIARPEAFAKCHTLYLGHDILPTGEQDALLKEREIMVHIIPDYYYRELEG